MMDCTDDLGLSTDDNREPDLGLVDSMLTGVGEGRGDDALLRPVKLLDILA